MYSALRDAMDALAIGQLSEQKLEGALVMCCCRKVRRR
jgi:hypothetical protein